MAPGGRSRSSTTSSFTSLRSESNRAPIAAEATPLALGGKSGGEHALKGHELSGWSASPTGDGGMGTSYASQHTLRTIRPGGGGSPRDDSPARSSAASEQEGDEWQEDPTTGQQVKRGNPKFIIDLAPTSGQEHSGTGSTGSLSASSTTHQLKTRDRSATFGGVPLPPSPSPQSTTNQPTSSSSSSNRPRPAITRLPSSSSVSLHLGGDESSFARRRPMLHAGLKAGALFLASLLALYILLKTLLPPIDEEHRDRVKLPKTFEELKGLNEVLQVSCAV